MSKHLVSLSAAAALTLAALGGSATAADAGAVHGVKTVGAMALETGTRATSARDVIRQGGLATAGTARWIETPAEAKAESAVVHGVGTVGAMTFETLGVPTSAADAYRQGAGKTARAVRWVAAPAS